VTGHEHTDCRPTVRDTDQSICGHFVDVLVSRLPAGDVGSGSINVDLTVTLPALFLGFCQPQE
jgi:hypothetical protein